VSDLVGAKAAPLGDSLGNPANEEQAAEREAEAEVPPHLPNVAASALLNDAPDEAADEEGHRDEHDHCHGDDRSPWHGLLPPTWARLSGSPSDGNHPQVPQAQTHAWNEAALR
jgi:hypothetical protein